MFFKKRLKNACEEFARLNTFMFSPSHLRCMWNIPGDVIAIQSAVPFQWMTNPDTGEDMVRKIDAFDRLFYVVNDFFLTYYENIFKHTQCNHSHDQVHEEWEGDREYGYFRQMYCRQCHSYVTEEIIDQYSTDRKPEEYVKSKFQPYSEDDFRNDDEDDDLDQDDDFDYDYYWREEENYLPEMD